MSQKVELRIEKELYEELFQNFKTLEEKVKEQESKIKAQALGFKQIGERRYRVYNKASGRFHNIELGIDEVM